MIRELLQNKTAKEKASIKGAEIAEIQSLPCTKRKDFDIEVVEIKAIEGGVEVFARAWNSQGQIGFGKDGTVDIERFRIFNPPILVDDTNGDIVKEYTDEITGITHQRKLKEDPQGALLQVIEHNLTVMKNIHGAERIVQGKRGNTTSTFYPAAGANSPVDGRMGRVANESFDNFRSGAGTYAQPTGVSGSSPSLYATATTDVFSALARVILGFATTPIGSDEISSATLSLYVSGGKSTGLGDTNIEIGSATPASDADLVTGDYAVANYGGTAFTASVAVSSITTSIYNDFSLNASGLSYINKSGNTMFGARLGWDFDNNFTGTWSSGSFTGFDLVFADTSGTTQDPKLVVEHSVAVSFNPTIMHHMQIAGGLM